MSDNLNFDNQEEDKKARFNGGISQLYRMDKLWQKGHEFGSAINYPKWNEILDRVWLELSPDAIEGEHKSIREIDLQLLAYGLYNLNENMKSFNPQLYNKIIIVQKNLLIKKEMVLRKIENRQGKGTAYQDSIEDYMDE